jgi:serine/threonine-protein kinase HipA
MKRREAAQAHQENRRARVLNEIDYLLGVHDLYRMGALRFKRVMDGPFLDNDNKLAAPPIARLRELEHAARQVEEKSDPDDPDYLKWLYMLIAPGSSLGGARPKASVIDENDALWIAKFPSRHDEYDVAAWEYVVHQLALRAGIPMSQCRIETFNGPYHTFITQRFDRAPDSRLHFSSAMTQLGHYDGDNDASYLELAEFLVKEGSDTEGDLAQLWRRIVFNIAVSNTDDHLRNHGFIYQQGGWKLSPAYDINPITPADGLHLFITDNDNRLDFGLAMEVIDFFRLKPSQAENIQDEVLAAVRNWRADATALKIGREEQNRMADAFKV